MDPEAAQAEQAITAFLAAARDPVLLEPGEQPFTLRPDSHALEWRGGRLSLEVWDETRNLVRRIVSVRERQPGRLELVIERFGRRQGQVSLIDRARSQPHLERRGERLVFREQFRQSLRRQFPGWELVELSSEANLEESLSPAYPRALLRKGAVGWAALASPAEPGAPPGALTFALIWLDYLRRRERRLTVEGVALFLPENEARPVFLRLPFLNARAARYASFVYTVEGFEERLDPRDYGNLETRLEACPPLPCLRAPHLAAWMEKLCAVPGVGYRTRPDGALSLHVRGVEFARMARGELLFGIEHKWPGGEAHLEEIEVLARELARLRSAKAADRGHPLFRLHPEGWLESLVRAQIEQVDASLRPEPLYNQVPAAAAGDRGVLDLLAVEHSGRLAVLELKASEDIHLPMQALDYWMRVKWHLERGEFSSRGYFPGVALREEWPRLLLIAPALVFHPKTETLLRFFAPGIEVERIGVSAEWREGIEVMFRIRGAARPYLEAQSGA